MDLNLDTIKALSHLPIRKRAISNHRVLNEAFSYAKPSLFSRGMRIDIGSLAILLISGTGSVDEQGRSVHIGDFRSQVRRTFTNVTALLQSEGATWHDVVRTTIYLREMERDYDAFNEERSVIFSQIGLDVYPASTAIQAALCRPELLLEIEAIAMFQTSESSAEGHYSGSPIGVERSHNS